MKKIALLGATGYIGRSLLPLFLQADQNISMFVFSRSKDKLKKLINTNIPGATTTYKICSLSDFEANDYDVILNCTGIGDPLVLNVNPILIFNTTEEIDAMIISYLKMHPKVMYINMSSGAIYGSNFRTSTTENSKIIFNGSFFNPNDYYAVSKLNSEAKHRSLSTYNIIDLRIFSFFSSYVDLKSVFLMSEIANCVLGNKVFKTTNEDISRDYITPYDLFELIQKVMQMKKGNEAFDVYSKAPIKKFKLLEIISKKCGLKYSIEKSKKSRVTSRKNIYYSKSKKAKKIGYTPKYSSIKGVLFELSKMKKSSKITRNII